MSGEPGGKDNGGRDPFEPKNRDGSSGGFGIPRGLPDPDAYQGKEPPMGPQPVRGRPGPSFTPNPAGGGRGEPRLGQPDNSPGISLTWEDTGSSGGSSGDPGWPDGGWSDVSDGYVTPPGGLPRVELGAVPLGLPEPFAPETPPPGVSPRDTLLGWTEARRRRKGARREVGVAKAEARAAAARARAAQARAQQAAAEGGVARTQSGNDIAAIGDDATARAARHQGAAAAEVARLRGEEDILRAGRQHTIAARDLEIVGGNPTKFLGERQGAQGAAQAGAEPATGQERPLVERLGAAVDQLQQLYGDLGQAGFRVQLTPTEVEVGGQQIPALLVTTDHGVISLRVDDDDAQLSWGVEAFNQKAVLREPTYDQLATSVNMLKGKNVIVGEGRQEPNDTIDDQSFLVTLGKNEHTGVGIELRSHNGEPTTWRRVS